MDYKSIAQSSKWMSPKQKDEFVSACMLIDSIKSPRDFYRIVNYINLHYDGDVVAAARELTKCYNSAQYM